MLAGQQPTVGQIPSSGLPLTPTILERGSSITPAFEGWYHGKDGNSYALVGYFNRNTKQELEISIGPNNRIEPGGPDLGQPTHFEAGRKWGVFAVKMPKGANAPKKLVWTLVANGFTNSITLTTIADYIIEPYKSSWNGNTPPVLKFAADGPGFTGPPQGIVSTLTTNVGKPVTLTAWISDDGVGARQQAGNAAPAGRGNAQAPAAAQALGRGGPGVTWIKHRGPGKVTFANAKPAIDASGKTETTATFDTPGEYVLRAQGNDATGDGGGGEQCCWTNAHIKVVVTGGNVSPTGN
jgi:hypothetical protein